jgi:hypothetical protein
MAINGEQGWLTLLISEIIDIKSCLSKGRYSVSTSFVFPFMITGKTDVSRYNLLSALDPLSTLYMENARTCLSCISFFYTAK